MHYNIILLGLVVCFGTSHTALGQTLTPQDVLNSARAHSPKILSAHELNDISNAAVLEAEGAFDATIEQDISSRIDGFYDGQQIDTQLVQPFAPLNTTFYTGYRVSDGSFPIYEDKRITTENGEWMVGLKLSLLRNRNIDARRLALANATLAQDAAQADVKQTVLSVQEQALIYYWDWVAAGLTYHVYHELLDIARLRQDAFKIRVNKGDLPSIYLTENEQYILQREVNVNNAQRKLFQSANLLSLYYRNDDGAPIVPDVQAIPVDFLPVDNTSPAPLSEWLDARPELRLIDAEMQQLDNDIDYGDNLRMPSADLAVEHANDYGSGPRSREAAETTISVQVSIPLQQRKADGHVRKAQAKQRQLAHKRRLIVDELTTQLNNSIVTLDTARDYITLTAREIELALTMQNAEQIRVDNGDSDYFLLVLRDENLAKARIKHIAAHALYQQAQARIAALTIQNDDLGL